MRGATFYYRSPTGFKMPHINRRAVGRKDNRGLSQLL